MTLPVEKRQQWIKSRREQRKLTRYARLRRQFLRYFVLVGILCAGIFVFYRMPCYLFESKDKLVIKGNLVASNAQICHALNPGFRQTPIFLLNPNELENRIKKLSIVKHAFVRRYLLPQPLMTVEVLEEFPWATLYCPLALPHGSKCLNMAKSGSQKACEPANTIDTNLTTAQFVMSESGRLIAIADFPNIYQPSLKIYTDNAKQFHLDQAGVEQWANWLGYISKQMQCPVLSLDMREPHNVKVETSKFVLVLGNPDSGLTRRLSRLASVLEVLASQHKDPAYVNLALNSNIPVKLAKKSDKTTSDEKVSRL